VTCMMRSACTAPHPIPFGSNVLPYEVPSDSASPPLCVRRRVQRRAPLTSARSGDVEVPCYAREVSSAELSGPHTLKMGWCVVVIMHALALVSPEQMTVVPVTVELQSVPSLSQGETNKGLFASVGFNPCGIINV
jgi:hypothetical protein